MPTVSTIISGAGWLGAIRLISRIADLIGLIICARILSPFDFGTIATAMVFVILIESITDLPISQALIRNPDRTYNHYATAFTISILRGILLAIVLCICGVVLWVVTADPTWALLLPFLSIAPVCRGLISPTMVEYAVTGDFRREFLVEVAGKVVSLGITIALVWQGFGFWSLAAGTVLSPAVSMLLSYVIAPFTPTIRLNEWRYFSKYIGWAAGAQAVTALNWQSDRLILSLSVPKTELGLYSLANDISQIPNQIMVNPLSKPLLVALSNNRWDSTKSVDTIHIFTVGLTAIMLPVLAIIALLSEPLVRVILGEKWLGSAYILQWLALIALPSTLSVAFSPLAFAAGKTQMIFKRSLFELFVKLPTIGFGAWYASIDGVIWALLFTALASSGYSLSGIQKLTGFSVINQLSGIERSFAATLALVPVGILAGRYMKQFSGLELSAMLIAVMFALLILYLAVSWAVWFVAGRPTGIESIAIKWLHKRFSRAS